MWYIKMHINMMETQLLLLLHFETYFPKLAFSGPQTVL